ncbi:MAG: ParB family protein [Pseudomonadota bacterium]|nr:ParB family protein [Pseudomonadota bacterium]
MNKHAPTGEALRSLLHMDHFGSDPGPLSLTDPLTRTTIHRVPIDQIDFYDRNPRRIRNPHYDEIKESIRASGILQNPKITRRPGAERYLLAFGGNTRLAILRELHRETGDARFAAVDCDFVPWRSEAEVLVGHLIENETRGELSFIDKARGVREARTLIESESGQTLSLRQLSAQLRERGFRIDSSMISRYEYAVDVLAEALPRALNAGLGRPQVQRLRQLDTVAQMFWQRRQLGTEAIYRAVFLEALAASDREDWDFERARRVVESALADRAGIEARLVTLELGADLAGAAESGDDTLVTTSTGTQTSPPAPPTSPDHASVAERARTQPNEPTEVMVTPLSQAEPKPEAAVAPEMPSPLPPLAGPRLEAAASDTSPDTAENKLEHLLTRLREAGQRYARIAGLEQCIRVDTDAENELCSYRLVDFPDAAQCEQARRSDTERQALAWKFWTLAQCCDLFGFIERRILDRFDTREAREQACVALFGPGSGFVRAWSDEGAAQQVVDETIGNADAYGYCDYVDTASPELWAADLALRQAYRDLRLFVREAGIDLWANDQEPPA